MKDYLLKTVVVPWDYSDSSKEALEAALAMVDSPSKVQVVHVASYPATMEPGVVWETITVDSLRAHLEQAFEKTRKASGFPELNFTCTFGDPGSQVSAFAKTNDAGLIIISSHGRTGLQRMLMGSVAERVVRLAPCPVLVLRETQSE